MRRALRGPSAVGRIRRAEALRQHAARCSKTRPLIPLHPRWRMAPRMQKAASRGPAQRHNEVSFKIERPERSGPTAPRCAARCAALRPPRWCTPPMRCETCTNAAACGIQAATPALSTALTNGGGRGSLLPCLDLAAPPDPTSRGLIALARPRRARSPPSRSVPNFLVSQLTC